MGTGENILDVPLIFDVPVERRGNGPCPPRASVISTKGASEEANCGSTRDRPESCAGGYRERALALPGEVDGGEALASTDISWAGLAGDRRWAFVRPDSQGSGFPWH